MYIGMCGYICLFKIYMAWIFIYGFVFVSNYGNIWLHLGIYMFYRSIYVGFVKVCGYIWTLIGA